LSAAISIRTGQNAQRRGVHRLRHPEKRAKSYRRQNPRGSGTMA